MEERVGVDGGSGVAIVGMAALYPGAPDLATYWSNICGGVDAITDVPRGRIDDAYWDVDGAPDAPDRFTCRRGGFVDDLATFDAARFGIMPLAAGEAEPDQLLALGVAANALIDAGYGEGLPDPARVGVILGRGGYLTAGMARLNDRVHTVRQLVATIAQVVPDLGADELAAIRREFQERLGPASPEASIGLVPNLVASRIANRLDLGGPAYTVDAACASSLLAVDQAARELETGRCDLVLAGGVHHCHDATFWSVFTQLGALSPTGTIRPFSSKADGLLIGEGTGMVALKRLDDARRDGDRVYAVVRGVGAASDGRGATLMSPSVDGQVSALDRAWRAAGLDPATVGLVEAHGTATPTGDAAELETMLRFFADAEDVGIGSVKSMIGHTMPACGVAGLIKAAMAVHEGVLPPTLHCEEPDESLRGTNLRPLAQVEEWEGAGPRRAGVSAFGFGGINAHVVLEQATSPGRRRRARAHTSAVAEPMVLLQSTPDGLRDRLESLRPGEQLVDLEATGPCRLAIVDPTEKRLGMARKVLGRGNDWRGRNDIWFSTDGLLSSGGRIAYVFPGVEPSFAPELASLERHFAAPAPGVVAADDLDGQGRSIVDVARYVQGILQGLGVRPDVMAGHSLGEWSAMIAAEAIPADRIDDFLASLDGRPVEVPGLVYLALGCPAEVAAEAIVGLDDIVVSHDNCPHQSIICGRESSVEVAEARLRSRRVLGQVLPFRSGFHSPMFAEFIGPFKEHLTRLPLQRPSVPLWSATTVGPFPDDPEEIRALAERLYTEPVRFRGLIDALYDDGVRVFVQPNLGSVTGFVEDTLGDRPHLAVAALHARRSGLAQVTRLAAALWTEGAEVDVARLCVDPGPRTGALPMTSFGEGMPLALARPLVRLEHAPTRASRPVTGGPTTTPSRPVGDHRLWGEFDATVTDVLAAGEEVLRALDGHHGVPAAPISASSAPPAEAPRSLEARRATWSLRLSLATHPHLADHAFYEQRDGWADAADVFPVVPMTHLLEIYRDFASQLVPERVVVGFENVRALRWLAVEPTIDVDVTLDFDGDHRIRASIDGYSRATILLAPSHTPGTAPGLVPPAGQPAPHTAEAMYAERLMFHGPAYRSVRRLGAMDDTGIAGRLVSLEAPGALLDGAGQLFGYWLMQRVEQDKVALPRHIERIEYFGPQPAPGTELDCVSRITELSDAQITSDLELLVGGAVWCRVTGWTDLRFESDAALWQLIVQPSETILADVDGHVATVSEHWSGTATRELVMRRFLDSSERAEYERLTPNAQRDWLLGRIAVKDLVRHHLWQHGAGPLFPAEIRVTNDPEGAPLVTGPFDADLRVSIGHRKGRAVAALAEGTGVGVDVELVEERGARFEQLTLTGTEVALLPAEDRGTWLTRFWVAKESAAKAAGTGLEGRPRDFVVRELDGERLRIDDRWITTRLDGDFVVGWTDATSEHGHHKGERDV